MPALTDLAARTGFAPARLAVAWLLSHGDDIVPLVGMSRRSRLPENLVVVDIALSAPHPAQLDQAFARPAILGIRYSELVMKYSAR